MGSASELEYHLLLTHGLEFFDDAVYEALRARVVGVKRMLASLIQRLKGRSLKDLGQALGADN